MSRDFYERKRKNIISEINELKNRIESLDQENKQIERIIKDPYWLILYDISNFTHDIIEMCLNYLVERWCCYHGWFMGNDCILCNMCPIDRRYSEYSQETSKIMWKLKYNAIIQLDIKKDKYNAYIIFLNDDEMRLAMYWNNPHAFYPGDILNPYKFGAKEIQPGLGNIFRFRCYICKESGINIAVLSPSVFEYGKFGLFILPRGKNIEFSGGRLIVICDDALYNSWFCVRVHAERTNDICDFINRNKLSY